MSSHLYALQKKFQVQQPVNLIIQNGSTSWTLTDLAAEISKQTDKEIPYVDIPAADYAAALVQAGLDEGFAGLIAQWDVDASNGALFSEDKTLDKLLGRPTAGLDVAVKQALSH